MLYHNGEAIPEDNLEACEAELAEALDALQWLHAQHPESCQCKAAKVLRKAGKEA